MKWLKHWKTRTLLLLAVIGPGFITAQLLALYPKIHITCVEIDPDLTAPAEQYLRSSGLQSWRFLTKRRSFFDTSGSRVKAMWVPPGDQSGS